MPRPLPTDATPLWLHEHGIPFSVVSVNAAHTIVQNELQHFRSAGETKNYLRSCVERGLPIHRLAVRVNLTSRLIMKESAQ